jgi:arylsulfatase A-like enzyme
MDFYPTLLELAGLPLQPAQHADGQSLVPILKGGPSLGRKAIFWHYPHYHGSTWTPGGALRAGNWKLVEFYEEGAAELYQLSDDPAEKHDLSKKHPAKKAELQKLLDGWRKRTGAKMPEPNPGYRPKPTTGTSSSRITL